MSHPSPGPSLRTLTALLALPLALLACEDKPARPASPGAGPVFKEPPRTPSPPAPSVPTPSVPAPSVPVAAPLPAPTPTSPPVPQGLPAPGAPPRKPEQLFNDMGCVACHGENRPYAARLSEARSKPDETVAVWILDPQKVRPGTLMPTFVGRLSTLEALSLARWIKAGNPVIPGVP